MGCDVRTDMTIFAHAEQCTHTLEARTYFEDQVFMQGLRTQIRETDGRHDSHSQPHKATKDQTLVARTCTVCFGPIAIGPGYAFPLHPSMR